MFVVVATAAFVIVVVTAFVTMVVTAFVIVAAAAFVTVAAAAFGAMMVFTLQLCTLSLPCIPSEWLLPVHSCVQETAL